MSSETELIRRPAPDIIHRADAGRSAGDPDPADGRDHGIMFVIPTGTDRRTTPFFVMPVNRPEGFVC
ncbi:MAG TPA: hypothetical protein VHC49_04085 [Mycobacteriales bacterium]|nr:hypothetical protein [Mycobacteriales bacterium]